MAKVSAEMQKQKEQAFRDGLANSRVIKADLDSEMKFVPHLLNVSNY